MNGGEGEHASAFRSTEVADGLVWRQEMRNVEDASGACCPGGVGIEVGKGQQAGARRVAVYSHHCGHLSF